MSGPVAPDVFPASIAIAGAWGYIGRKFLDAAIRRGLRPHVYDPGPLPADVDATRVSRVTDEAAFYALDADLFHLALHPEHRRLDLLLGRREPLLILNEKPMALPERPDLCAEVVAAVDASEAVVLYDFPELFDPLTSRVVARLRGFRDLRIDEIRLDRAKDREDPVNRRNDKRMVTIQYQESVHCLAWLLHVLAAVRGGLDAALADGLTLSAEARPYAPPNPEAYPHIVDGRCDYEGTVGGVAVRGCTNFQRHAPWLKRRVVRGMGDGRPFTIEVSYLEGAKSLAFDGVAQPCDPAADSYESAIAGAVAASRAFDRRTLLTGLFPHPRFARATYQLSSILWRSSRDRRPITVGSLDALYGFDAGYAEEALRLGRYGP